MPLCPWCLALQHRFLHSRSASLLELTQSLASRKLRHALSSQYPVGRYPRVISMLVALLHGIGRYLSCPACRSTPTAASRCMEAFKASVKFTTNSCHSQQAADASCVQRAPGRAKQKVNETLHPQSDMQVVQAWHADTTIHHQTSHPAPPSPAPNILGNHATIIVICRAQLPVRFCLCLQFVYSFFVISSFEWQTLLSVSYFAASDLHQPHQGKLPRSLSNSASRKSDALRNIATPLQVTCAWHRP